MYLIMDNISYFGNENVSFEQCCKCVTYIATYIFRAVSFINIISPPYQVQKIFIPPRIIFSMYFNPPPHVSISVTLRPESTLSTYPLHAICFPLLYEQFTLTPLPPHAVESQTFTCTIYVHILPNMDTFLEYLPPWKPNDSKTPHPTPTPFLQHKCFIVPSPLGQ